MSHARRKLLFILAVTAMLFLGTALSQSAVHLRYDGTRITCTPISLITREDRLVGPCHTLPELENGDILLTFSTHSFGWRHGHAGLVVDQERGLVLEAVILGCPSCVVSAEHWRSYETLQVLRLKNTDSKLRQAVADYALENLNHIPYRLSSGWFGESTPDTLTVQCAYLVWYAYSKFGYDLDSDGGVLVTVSDLASSPLLELQ